MNLYTYKGYRLRRLPTVTKVYDPRDPDNKPIWVGSSTEAAKKWITAYRKGHQWAVNERLPIIKFALTLAALLAVATPALALGEAEAWQRYLQMQQPFPQPQQWTYPNQPTAILPPAQYLQPPQRLQTTCYLIGNILTCY
jgi:hypothetical protein